VATGLERLCLGEECDLHGIAYKLRAKDNSGKAPLKRSPWAEIDGEVVAKSGRIIARLPPSGHPLPDAAEAAAFKLGAEEASTRSWNGSSSTHPEGPAYITKSIPGVASLVVSTVVSRMVVLHSRKPLLARGISLSSEEIAAKGRTFFYALEPGRRAATSSTASRPT
jgi:hypothetical protein